MDIIITFFRDILDGPLYIAVAIINSILICSCIGYLGEQYLNKKKEEEKISQNYADVSVLNQVNDTQASMVQNSSSVLKDVTDTNNTAAPVVNNAVFSYNVTTDGTSNNPPIDNNSLH